MSRLGAADQALEEIERLLTSPSVFVSAPQLRLDPRRDRIRDGPRFQVLLLDYAGPQPVR